MSEFRQWTTADAAGLIAVPGTDGDKYSRGVLGVATGSATYPGAAVLGVEAAVRTGVGMVRYLGDAAQLVLQRRPEVVTVPGRVQAWLLGSGIDPTSRDDATTDRLRAALGEKLPTVVDSGALDLIGDASGLVVITPHFRELAGLLSVDPDAIRADPELWCARAEEKLGVTVLLKGSRTRIAGTDGTRLQAPKAPNWLATAGTGDVLGGILGALLATHADAIDSDSSILPKLAATAALLHGQAAERASSGGPIAALDVAIALPQTIARLLREHSLGE